MGWHKSMSGHDAARQAAGPGGVRLLGRESADRGEALAVLLEIPRMGYPWSKALAAIAHMGADGLGHVLAGMAEDRVLFGLEHEWLAANDVLVKAIAACHPLGA